METPNHKRPKMTKCQENKASLRPLQWMFGGALAFMFVVLLMSWEQGTLKARFFNSNEEITSSRYDDIKTMMKENPDCPKGKELVSRALEGDSKIVYGEFFDIKKTLTACNDKRDTDHSEMLKKRDIEAIKTLLNADEETL